MPQLYVIAGCNGAGKTTASFTVLPEMLNCREFVNADEIARGISPFQPESVAMQAGRVMLTRINELLAHGVDFAFETTLATRSYVGMLKRAKKNGYFVSLIYFWLNDPQLAVDRVNRRVESGGHYIASDVVHRRYRSGLLNFFDLYMPTSDHWMVVDNSEDVFSILAEGTAGIEVEVFNNRAWETIKQHYTQWKIAR